MTTRSAAPPPSGLAIVLGGALSLAVAMGIGRFAFTPMLPLMAREGLLDVSAGGWLAAANYLGYLVGALTAARLPWKAATLGVVALLVTAAVTAAMVRQHALTARVRRNFTHLVWHGNPSASLARLQELLPA